MVVVVVVVVGVTLPTKGFSECRKLEIDLWEMEKICASS